MVQGALACGEESSGVGRVLATRRAAGVAAIRRRFQRAINEGDLPAGADAAVLARFVATIMHGLEVEAASGARRREPERLNGLILRTWPI
jgi:hypothetical protein